MKDLLADFIHACHEVDRFHLAYCSSGNMSCRTTNGNTAYLTATGSWFGRIDENSIAECDIATGDQIGDIRPSVESRFHLGILREHEQANVILHFQSPYATAIAAGKKLPDNFNVILEMPYYIGKPTMIDFLPPGSQELADSVVAASKTSAMILIQNHGMVTYGSTLDETIQKAVFFELACKIISHQGNLNYISDQMADSLKNA